MTTTKEEMADLVKLHEDQRKECENFSSLVHMYLEMEDNPEQLKHCGQKSVEGAIFSAAKDHRKKLQNLAKAHVKKWPDK